MFAATAPFRKAAARAMALLAMVWLAACDATLPAGLGTGPLGNDGPGIRPGETVQVALLVPQSDPQAGPATMSDHDPSAPIEGTGAWSDAHGTHAARATRTRRRH